MRAPYLFFLGIIIPLSILFVACESDAYPVQAEFVPANACWEISDTLTFEGNLSALGVSIELKQDYDYQNLYIKALATDEAGKEIEWMKNLKVLSPGGEWLDFEKGSDGVRKKMGDTYRIVQPIAFEDFTPTKISLFHFMREASLCGVTHVKLVDLEK